MTYNIYQDDALIGNTEDKEYTVEDLKPNTEYSFAVTEVIGDKESEKATITVKTKPIAVMGVTIAPKTATLEVGETQQLTATVAPANATDKSVTYASKAQGVASVDDKGLVTAKAAGEAEIVVTTADGSKTDTCIVTVTEPVPEPDPEGPGDGE
ncbi:Ig-like domain-containing protein [Lederbergia sp. NSJ-179]|uniref:Ig-like domain-containing protein n=1 Tax=Lederbergia sp. NSJ-179 TaxID=2931402 RepID=UPI001FD4D640|nr:Ig-like domain-containing protein [Lederbergia sp. NSJ-179]MCJ7840511.1 Ig-like domain-containing protein [Lederbergia sp. NSJ-179]